MRIPLTLLVVAAAIAAATTATSASATPLALPAPTGTLATGTTTLHLVDRTRRDPLAGGRRELMVQLWYPAARRAGRPAQYMTPGTAAALEASFGLPRGTLASLETHAFAGVPIASGRHPVLVYSHGLGTIRGFNTSLLDELASRGYVVAAIDHTSDAGLVEFPGGRIVKGVAPAVPTTDQNARLLATRVADVRFVLDELTRRTNAPAGLLAHRLDLSRVGALGHSFGGATAAAAMLADRRIKAGADLDGKIWGPVVAKGLERPFLLVIGDSLGAHPTPDQAAFLSHLRGKRYALRLAGGGHFSFTDLPLFAAAVPGLDRAFDVGTVEPERADGAVRAYVAAFFASALDGRSSMLLAGPSSAYPEVRFLR
jgi:predicted dienelactone hydrolase